MLSHLGHRVTDYELSEIFAGAYQRVATIDKAAKGFKSSGICPYNPDMFCDEDYAPATVTEQPLEPQLNNPATVDPHTSAEPQRKKRKKQRKQAPTPVAQPVGCQTPRSHTHVSVLDISPLPRASSCGVHKRKAESATLITSSPYKALLESKKKPAKSRLDAAKCSVEDPKKSSKKKEKKSKTEVKTKVRQKRLSVDTKTSGQRKIRSKAIFSRPLDSRMPLIRKPVWLQKKCQSGIIKFVTFN